MSDNFDKFMRVELKRIEVDKWIKGEKIKADPGNTYVENWVGKNGKDFRDAWNLSKCKSCRFCLGCGFEVKLMCDNFEPINVSAAS